MEAIEEVTEKEGWERENGGSEVEWRVQEDDKNSILEYSRVRKKRQRFFGLFRKV